MYIDEINEQHFFECIKTADMHVPLHVWLHSCHIQNKHKGNKKKLKTKIWYEIKLNTHAQFVAHRWLSAAAIPIKDTHTSTAHMDGWWPCVGLGNNI